ncbi:hypothetical protein M9Y10_014812 [Tritrichomonas musculus]|uniref:Zona occludens toxin N-terminal domain-containing protein n=2 Tax=Tritrichomonas musculus TaxID=1915356 RepID=A0ABR2L1F6_9EUKA
MKQKGHNVLKDVETVIKETLRKNQRDIEMALIKPLSPEYPFSTNGIYFLIGKMGAGKSFFIWRHIMITERLFKQPYYSKIIFCSSSGKLDKTAEVLSKNIKTRIDYVKESDLMRYLNRHLRRKLKYYSLVKHVMSKMKETNDEMRRLIQKHSLNDIEDRIAYIAQKMMKYDTSAYPYNTLLVLDDAAGSPLLKNGNSELCRLLTKTRHFNLTCIIAVQTLRFIHLNVKRLATDIICYSGFSKEDFMSMLQQTPNNLDVKTTTEEYLNHKGSHDRFIINITNGSSNFEIE